MAWTGALIAALPQRVWEVVATASAAYLVGFGILDLIQARSSRAQGRGGISSEGKPWRPSFVARVRVSLLLPLVSILLGLGIGIAGFLIDAEPSCGRCGQGAWGNSTDVTVMLAWLLVVLAGAVRRLQKLRQAP
jgi:hypothetical protein